MYKTNQFDFFIHSSRIWVRHSYNALNLKAELTNARGQIRKFFYDALGRITGYLAEENEVCYTYDDNGNILTVSDRNGTITRTYDALNRVTSYTDTFGNVIQYRYDAVGNLEYLIYPDGSEVYYSYDVNNNLVSVSDWAGRTTTYTYDQNNRVVGVTKPDGSTTATVYDDKQRIVSTVEKLPDDTIISGFEYEYDEIGRISSEKVLAKNEKMCYTYDEQSRVTKRTIVSLSGTTETEETFSYDGAGNITADNSHNFVYDTNNRLTEYKGNSVTYDDDGNMLSNGTLSCSYDSGNRLISAGGHTYTYDAENVRVRNLCEAADEDTTYTYNTNAKLSMLLMKTTNGVVTKYVYGKGLIGEEVGSVFKTYHFDCRGSTIAITDASGNITDTFAYDTYGKLLTRTGTNKVIFGYNGRDGVVTDDNGLIYMRARYYSPEMKRFINADVIAGAISNAITLNRFAYANGNPVSFVDPFGLWSLKSAWNGLKNWVKEEIVDPAVDFVKEKIVDPAIDAAKTTFKNIENLYLKAEASWSDVYNTTFNNHEENLKYDVKNDIIYDQDTVCEDIKLGDHTMPYAGCEVIAVYNARILLGYADVSLADTIEQFANCGALTMQPVLRGGFGGNPFSIGKVLKAENLKYSTIESFEQMKGTPGVYIVSVWNSNDFDSMIHTIAIEIVDGEEPRMINGDFNMDSTTEDIFITGYKVSRK